METGEYTWEQLRVQTEWSKSGEGGAAKNEFSSYTSTVFIEVDHCDRGEKGQ